MDKLVTNRVQDQHLVLPNLRFVVVLQFPFHTDGRHGSAQAALLNEKGISSADAHVD